MATQMVILGSRICGIMPKLMMLGMGLTLLGMTLQEVRVAKNQALKTQIGCCWE